MFLFSFKKNYFTFKRLISKYPNTLVVTKHIRLYNVMLEIPQVNGTFSPKEIESTL